MLICSLVFEPGKVSNQPTPGLNCDKSYAGITALPAPVPRDDISGANPAERGVSETHCYLNSKLGSKGVLSFAI